MKAEKHILSPVENNTPGSAIIELAFQDQEKEDRAAALPIRLNSARKHSLLYFNHRGHPQKRGSNKSENAAREGVLSYLYQ